MAAEAHSTATLRLTVGDLRIVHPITVPSGRVPATDVVPALQGLVNAVVAAAEAGSTRDGKSISCRKGCGACCRQLVPVSQAEARALAALVAAMPEPRRDEIHRRFDAALQTLHAGGVVTEIDAARDDTSGAAKDLGIRYFHQGVACPFLEDEACSIHPDRPLSCRQYLVTSPAANCASPSLSTIVTVTLPARPSQALLLADNEDAGATWMPLVYALGYADEVPARARVRTAPDILRDVFSRLQESGGRRK